MFVLDGSSSVHIINYLRTLVAMKKAIFSFLDDYSNSRIGLITYASGIQDVMPPTNDKTVFSASERFCPSYFICVPATSVVGIGLYSTESLRGHRLTDRQPQTQTRNHTASKQHCTH